MQIIPIRVIEINHYAKESVVIETLKYVLRNIGWIVNTKLNNFLWVIHLVSNWCQITE